MRTAKSVPSPPLSLSPGCCSPGRSGLWVLWERQRTPPPLLESPVSAGDARTRAGQVLGACGMAFGCCCTPGSLGWTDDYCADAKLGFFPNPPFLYQQHPVYRSIFFSPIFSSLSHSCRGGVPASCVCRTFISVFPCTCRPWIHAVSPATASRVLTACCGPGSSSRGETWLPGPPFSCWISHPVCDLLLPRPLLLPGPCAPPNLCRCRAVRPSGSHSGRTFSSRTELQIASFLLQHL